ncbi:MAG: hypothetical protein O7C58_07525 [Rickettsia endosymbiont of Ixodes persulcatus]|nr:hypothetical protein [Rickettsia endosymbiont of Ixodes persulcatus]MCZ6903793.1 hypothetical protein [Rickettsia endosymbiont of Ixodes persulcatus]MCZ6919401.1 hypothetical protein [Rickettsia endosymbiont of Ixodes persulcatus]MCZ6924771.1 hypothetical protein [Rickettsia endosymbiont of Ixodes persulcatus]
MHFLIHRFDSESNDPKKISAVRFYKKVDKTLFTQYLQKEKQDLNVVNKVEIFAKEHAWTIAGICKNMEPELQHSSTHISHLPSEIIQEITSYLDNSKWGIEAKVAVLGEV